MRPHDLKPYGRGQHRPQPNAARNRTGRLLAWSGLILGPVLAVVFMGALSLPQDSCRVIQPILVISASGCLLSLPCSLVGIVLIRKRIALDWGLFILGGLLAMLALIGVLTTSTPPPS